MNTNSADALANGSSRRGPVSQFFYRWNNLPVVIALSGIVGLISLFGGAAHAARDIQAFIDWSFDLTKGWGPGIWYGVLKRENGGSEFHPILINVPRFAEKHIAFVTHDTAHSQSSDPELRDSEFKIVHVGPDETGNCVILESRADNKRIRLQKGVDGNLRAFIGDLQPARSGEFYNKTAAMLTPVAQR
jgi:hypothetical protein